MGTQNPFTRWLKLFGDDSLFCLMTLAAGDCPESWLTGDQAARNR